MPPLSTPPQTPLAPKPTKPPPPLPPPPAAMAAVAQEELPLWRSKHRLLRPRRRTNPLVWCFAILCFLFSLLLIFAGILILVVFLFIKPRNPQFDAAAASLNGIYIDSPPAPLSPSSPGHDYYYLNGDLTLLANISNPNRHIDVAFRYVSVELYFRDRLVAAQGLEPFAQRRGEVRIASLHMVTSEVGLPRELAAAMEEEVGRGRVSYSVRATFKVRASLGFGHLTYWLYGRCDIDLSPPPSGVLLASSCSTKH